MKQPTLILITAVTLALSVALFAQQKSKEAGPVGTWHLVSEKSNGRSFVLPDGERHVKIITPTHFMWVAYDDSKKVISSSMDGSCSFTDGKYTEIIEFCYPESMKDYVGKKQEFTVRVEGEKLYQSGKLSDGLQIEEVWERAKAPQK